MPEPEPLTGRWQRLGWFVGLWAAGVGTVALVGLVLRLWLLG